MKTLLKVTLYCLLSFMTVSAALAQSEAELKAKIEHLNQEMVKHMLADDMDKCMMFYAEDVISLPNYDKMITGTEGLKKSNEKMKEAGWKVIDFKPTTLFVKSCGDMVTEIGTFEIAFSMKGTDKPMKDAGKYITLWEKQKDGSLKIKVETWNTDKYPGEPMKE